VRDDGDVLVALGPQKIDRQVEPLAGIGIERHVKPENRGALQHRQLDGERGVALLRDPGAQRPVQLEVRAPAAPMRDDDRAARLLGLGVQGEEAVAVLLLQPLRLADHEGGENVIGPAFLALVVLSARRADEGNPGE